MLTVSGTMGTVSILGLGVVGFRRSCSDVGNFFPWEIMPLGGLRTPRLDGHCWRPQRARLLGFLVTSQGSSLFLAHVTLRIRTPPPQDTEHWKRERHLLVQWERGIGCHAQIHNNQDRKLNCAAEIVSFVFFHAHTHFTFGFCVPLVSYGNMYLLGTSYGSGPTIYPPQTENTNHDIVQLTSPWALNLWWIYKECNDLNMSPDLFKR